MVHVLGGRRVRFVESLSVLPSGVAFREFRDKAQDILPDNLLLFDLDWSATLGAGVLGSIFSEPDGSLFSNVDMFARAAAASAGLR